MSSNMTHRGISKQGLRRRFSMKGTGKLQALGSVYAGLMGLTGCATSAELESLRAEVVQANTTAAIAKAEVSRMQREVVELKAAIKPLQVSSKPMTYSTAAAPKQGGYKWGVLPSQYPR